MHGFSDGSQSELRRGEPNSHRTSFLRPAKSKLCVRRKAYCGWASRMATNIYPCLARKKNWPTPTLTLSKAGMNESDVCSSAPRKCRACSYVFTSKNVISYVTAIFSGCFTLRGNQLYSFATSILPDDLQIVPHRAFLFGSISDPSLKSSDDNIF